MGDRNGVFLFPFQKSKKSTGLPLNIHEAELILKFISLQDMMGPLDDPWSQKLLEFIRPDLVAPGLHVPMAG